MDGVGLTVVLLITWFAIDRIVKALLFLLSYSVAWSKHFPDPSLVEEQVRRCMSEKVAADADNPEASVEARNAVLRARANQRTVYYVFTAFCGIVMFSWLGGVRFFHALGFAEMSPLYDILVTGIILSAGAEGISTLLRVPELPGAKTLEHVLGVANRQR